MRSLPCAVSLDRASDTERAAKAYLDAAGGLPAVADWLALRAAGAMASKGERADVYGRLRTGVARGRVAITEAQALSRSRDYEGAARAYDSLGLAARGLRMRLLALGPMGDVAAKAPLHRDALALLDRPRSTDEAREAIDLLDDALGPLAPAEELRVARGAAKAGLLRRAATGFAKAAAAGALEPADRYTYGRVLARLGENRNAATQLALVPATSPLANDASYLRARSLVRAGSRSSAMTLLRRLSTAKGVSAEIASGARYLLADLASDDGRDSQARSSYLALQRAYPSAPLASSALFRAAIIAYAAGSHATAARELDSLAARYRSSDDALAALYWSGRAWAAAGQQARARDRWREVIRREGASYYALASAKRLGQAPWMPAAPADTADTNSDATLAEAVRRLEVLATLGLATERDLEIENLSDAATGAKVAGVARELATAEAFRRAGLPWRAIRLARAALAAGAPRDRRSYTLLYPLPYAELIKRDAAARRLDPALVAALIHQESGFNPRATSGAGAMGLMQVMPAVGRELARARGDYPVWDRALLYEPDVSLDLGTAHLATMLSSYPDLAYALAAYNAGQSPVRRWRQLPGANDPELFIERIPYDETRDYVRILTRNRGMYAGLYKW
jgi:soluble lytic murein transglycosylase